MEVAYACLYSVDVCIYKKIYKYRLLCCAVLYVVMYCFNVSYVLVEGTLVICDLYCHILVFLERRPQGK